MHMILYFWTASGVLDVRHSTFMSKAHLDETTRIDESCALQWALQSEKLSQLLEPPVCGKAGCCINHLDQSQT